MLTNKEIELLIANNYKTNISKTYYFKTISVNYDYKIRKFATISIEVSSREIEVEGDKELGLKLINELNNLLIIAKK